MLNGVVVNAIALQTVQLSNNYRMGVRLLSAMPMTLSTLVLGNCNLTADHVRALSACTELTHLDINSSDLGDFGVAPLRTLHRLQTLDVSACQVADGGAVQLATELPSLVALDIDRNHLTIGGARAVLAMPRLLWADLRKNHIAGELNVDEHRLRVDAQHSGPPPAPLKTAFMDGIRDRISLAFDGVPPPGPEDTTLYQAEAADNFRDADQSRDHLGRWQDLPLAHLVDCQWAFAHLDAVGVRYYLPAILQHALHGRLEGEYELDHLIESTRYSLTPSPSDELRLHYRDRLGLLDQTQRSAIAAWAAIQSDHELRAAWARVVDHDARGGEDWFEAFWPLTRPAERPPPAGR